MAIGVPQVRFNANVPVARMVDQEDDQAVDDEGFLVRDDKRSRIDGNFQEEDQEEGQPQYSVEDYGMFFG